MKKTKLFLFLSFIATLSFADDLYHSNIEHFQNDVLFENTNRPTYNSEDLAIVSDIHNGKLSLTFNSTNTVDFYANDSEDKSLILPGKPIFYGTCDTDAGTRNKTVNLVPEVDSTLFNLIEGTVIFVKFKNKQSYSGSSSVNLVVAGTSAPIYKINGTGVKVNEWAGGELLCLIYSESKWIIVDGALASSSNFGSVQIGTNINIENGVISIPLATSNNNGVVSIGNNIDVDNGIISVKDGTIFQQGIVQLEDSATSTSTTTALVPNSLNQFILDSVFNYETFSEEIIYNVGDRVRREYSVYECLEDNVSGSWSTVSSKFRAIEPIQTQIDEIDSNVSSISNSVDTISDKVDSIESEEWTFTLDDGSQVTKKICVIVMPSQPLFGGGFTPPVSLTPEEPSEEEPSVDDEEPPEDEPEKELIDEEPEEITDEGE